jgi:hypothetical protein
MTICKERWFQIFERAWRPFQGWGFSVCAIAYGIKPTFGLSFQVETFAALTAAAVGGFVTRAVEKHKRDKLEFEE